MCGFIAQLVEHRTGIAVIVEVTGSNPVEAMISSGFFFPFQCLHWKIHCDDHSSLKYFSNLNYLTINNCEKIFRKKHIKSF